MFIQGFSTWFITHPSHLAPEIMSIPATLVWVSAQTDMTDECLRGFFYMCIIVVSASGGLQKAQWPLPQILAHTQKHSMRWYAVELELQVEVFTHVMFCRVGERICWIFDSLLSHISQRFSFNSANVCCNAHPAPVSSRFNPSKVRLSSFQILKTRTEKISKPFSATERKAHISTLALELIWLNGKSHQMFMNLCWLVVLCCHFIRFFMLFAQISWASTQNWIRENIFRILSPINTIPKSMCNVST